MRQQVGFGLVIFFLLLATGSAVAQQAETKTQATDTTSVPSTVKATPKAPQWTLDKPLPKEAQIPTYKQAAFCRFEDKLSIKLGIGIDIGVEGKARHSVR